MATGVVVAVVLGACAAADAGVELRSDVERDAVVLSETSDVVSVVEATTALGVGLLAPDSTENQLISPASVAVALSMLAEGARGDSAAELDRLLGAAGQDRTDAFNALQSAMQEYDGAPDVDDDDLPDVPLLHLANGIVVDEDRTVEDEFLDRLAAGYDAGVRVAELSDASGKAALDAWVRKHTGGRVEASAIRPDPDLYLVLQNAVVLAARWEAPFEAGMTRDLPFTLGTGDEIELATMVRRGDMVYADDGPWQAVRLPYTEAFAMDVVLPTEGTAPTELTADDWATLDAAFATPQQSEVLLALPKVDMATSTSLLEPLEALGLTSLFTFGRADLTGIAPDLFVSAVAHQATLTMDEEGTVAAAVTEIGAEAGAAPEPTEPVEMTVDRPFAIRVVHIETGWPLFLGAVQDPRG